MCTPNIYILCTEWILTIRSKVSCPLSSLLSSSSTSYLVFLPVLWCFFLLPLPLWWVQWEPWKEKLVLSHQDESHHLLFILLSWVSLISFSYILKCSGRCSWIMPVIYLLGVGGCRNCLSTSPTAAKQQASFTRPLYQGSGSCSVQRFQVPGFFYYHRIE